jgi:hypothetical protein
MNSLSLKMLVGTIKAPVDGAILQVKIRLSEYAMASAAIAGNQ